MVQNANFKIVGRTIKNHFDLSTPYENVIRQSPAKEINLYVYDLSQYQCICGKCRILLCVLLNR
jgi:hypothetical protein